MAKPDPRGTSSTMYYIDMIKNGKTQIFCQAITNEEFSSLNMGTYNFYGPSQPQKHTDLDVITWIEWGNVQ